MATTPPTHPLKTPGLKTRPLRTPPLQTPPGKLMPTWRDDDEADAWLQSANLNEYGPSLKGELLVEWLERQEGPTLETLQSQLTEVSERLADLVDEITALRRSVSELKATRRRGTPVTPRAPATRRRRLG
jgi:hypothetical protein